MEKSEIIDLFNQDQRIDVVYPNFHKESSGNIIRHSDSSGRGESIITFSRIDEKNADRIITEQVNYFESIGHSFEWKVYDYDEPPDLTRRLGSRGFTIGDPESLVLLDLDNAPEKLWQPVSQDVQRVVDPVKLVDVERIEEQVWDEDSSWVNHLLGGWLKEYPDLLSVYVAYMDNQPASAAWTFFTRDSQFASLWGGATIKTFRKRGLYTALLAVRAQEARTRGVRYLTVDANPISRPTLEKFGFRMIATTYACHWRKQFPSAPANNE